MKIAPRHGLLLAGAVFALPLAGCHHGSSTPAGITTPTPTGSVPWTWLGGQNIVGRSGVYNAQTPGLLVPGSRDGAASWIDSAGNLWLLGGVGYDVSGSSGSLNDLWEYQVASGQWRFVSGSTTVNAPGVYSTVGTGIAPGTATAPTTPGARASAAAWIDASNNLWLFGGVGLDGTGTQGDLNDVWEYTPANNTWTWIGGLSTANAKGVYASGTGIPASQVTPGAREGAATWTDATGHFWLFGGGGYDSVGDNGLLNDLWTYNPSSHLWTFVGTAADATTNSNVANNYPTYGTMGTAAAANVPGGRQAVAGWFDKSGNVWVFGGQGYDSNKANGFLNDLWKFSPSSKQWTWVGGNDVIGAPGVYGTLATPASGNLPGARAGSLRFTDTLGNFWVFGGQGYDGNGTAGYLNDLWEYNVTSGQWQYVSGSTTINAYGTYGTLGVGSTANGPGARYGAAGWIDATNRIWVFGGGGYDVNSLLGDLNDLWRVPVSP